MPARPNIVVITCHDLGHHLGCYGIRSVRTPFLDCLAGEGMRFANSFCTSPGCSPSRAALATGRYPHTNGVLGLAHAHFGWDLKPEERHTASLLAEAGYDTGLFGLQHVTYDVGRLGFQHVLGGRPADEVAANFREFVDGRLNATNPFYAEINFFEPHRPFDFGGVEPDTTLGVQVPGFLPDCPESCRELAMLQGAIGKVDRAVEELDASLIGAGLRDDTLLLFTADHGLAFPRAKGTLNDPGIETALIVRWPDGGIRGGRVVPDLVSNIDILPTLLEIAGVELPHNLQGHSFAAILVGGVYAPRDCVFAEKTFHNRYDPLRAIRTDRWKLIARFENSDAIEVPADIMRGPTYPTVIDQVVQPAVPFELYDLHRDPLERENLAADDAHADTLQDLQRRLTDWMVETADPLLCGPIASPFYDRTLAALRAV